MSRHYTKIVAYSMSLRSARDMFVLGALLASLFPLAARGEQIFPGADPGKPHEQTGPQRPPAQVNPEVGGKRADGRKREELEAEISALEAERSRLLARFASAHPDVRMVERKLAMRRQQLEELGQAK